MKVSVDLDLCEANGLCMDACPEVFEVTDLDVLVVHHEHVTPAHRAELMEAIRLCPRGALTLAE